MMAAYVHSYHLCLTNKTFRQVTDVLVLEYPALAFFFCFRGL
jgi:hypothetical protein